MSATQYAIVVSQFNQPITDALLSGALSRLQAHGIAEQHVKIISVPGAIEIPLVAKRLAQANTYAAIICLGAVIRGDTDHYDYVCQQVSQGCQQVMMEFSIPVIFGVLTTNNLKQAKARINPKKNHKGIEAADAAIAMTKVMMQLQTP